ncbi:MAG: hypothetical protein PVI90_11385 [Desulfobacteraceae bacterium]|jgi:hypothetical protein
MIGGFAQGVDRLLSMGLYALLAMGVIVFGARLVNHAVDSKFYNEYLIGWEMALVRFHNQSGSYPVFKGGNHLKYMRQLVQTMARKMSVPPISNTRQPFLYVIDKIGHAPQRVFLLALHDRLVIYNLPPETIQLLDKMIDGRSDLTHGLFTGKQSKDGKSYIGAWQL